MANGQSELREGIKRLILRRGLRRGDPLPTETELMGELSASRNSLREALKALQALDIVEIRHGFGTYVGQLSVEPFADGLAFRGRLSLRHDLTEVRELVDVRQALEVGLIGQVIALASPGDVKALRDIVEEMERLAPDRPIPADLDREFHECLYRPLGNQLMSQLLRAFWDVYHDLSAELHDDTVDADEIHRIHRDICDAVSARDSDRAVAAVNTHFEGIRSRLSL